METKLEAKSVLAKVAVRPYPLRCPNPQCGKTHFTIEDTLVPLLTLAAECTHCNETQMDKLSSYLIHPLNGRVLMKMFCHSCSREFEKIVPAIRRVCERCGWEGEFYLSYKSLTIK